MGNEFHKDKRPRISRGTSERTDKNRGGEERHTGGEGRYTPRTFAPRPDGPKPHGENSRGETSRGENYRGENSRGERHTGSGWKPSKPSDGQRRSYNPNFNGDNTLRSGGGRDTRDSRDARDSRDSRDTRYGRDTRDTRNGRDARKSPRKPFSPHPKGGFDSGSHPSSYPSYKPEVRDQPQRLNKYISASGLCSRREADEFIRQGLVTVNGAVVTEMGVKVNPGDEVKYNGRVLEGEKMVYILMNKPKGFVTTTDDPNAERTVIDIIKNACKERVYPVGRLDKSSLGVLLITNDGELTKKLTHPSHSKKKIYEVALDKPASRADLEKLLEGVELEDGLAAADEIDYVGESKKDVGIAVHSGRNRVVRRMFEALGYRVNKLDRVYFAGLTKKGLRRGAWRYLTLKEIGMLKSGKYE